MSEPNSRIDTSAHPEPETELAEVTQTSRRGFLKTSAATALVPATLAGMAEIGDSPALAKGGKPKPLHLADQGTFFVGGSIEFRDPNSSTPNDPKFIAGNIAVDQMFVEYQIPERQKYRYPLIMMHGGGHSGNVFRTTPDGREGWFTTFTRRGFAVYVVDAPNRGRTGYDPTHRFAAIQGLEPASAMEPGNMYSAQSAWTAFRWGPSFGVPYPNTQFPLDHLNEYLRQVVPSYRDNPENDFIAQDLEALIDRIGPCIVLGWSTGTGNVMIAATERLNLAKAVIGLEGFPPNPGRSAVDLNLLAKLPFLGLVADNTSPDPFRAFTQQLVSLGADATTVWLPDIGLFGNGHTMMMELDNERIADVIVDWINHHVPGVRGR